MTGLFGSGFNTTEAGTEVLAGCFMNRGFGKSGTVVVLATDALGCSGSFSRSPMSSLESPKLGNPVERAGLVSIDLFNSLLAT